MKQQSKFGSRTEDPTLVHAFSFLNFPIFLRVGKIFSRNVSLLNSAALSVGLKQQATQVRKVDNSSVGNRENGDRTRVKGQLSWRQLDRRVDWTVKSTVQSFSSFDSDEFPGQQQHQGLRLSFRQTISAACQVRRYIYCRFPYGACSKVIKLKSRLSPARGSAHSRRIAGAWFEIKPAPLIFVRAAKFHNFPPRTALVARHR